MMKLLSIALMTVLGSLALNPSAAHAVDLKQAEDLLASQGLEGEIHGASPELGLFVFTYRNPSDFFDFVEMSLVADSSEAQKSLATLQRHDRVRVHGAFLPNPSPQKHIAVSRLELVRRYESRYPSEPYRYQASLPDELTRTDSALFLVHAVRADGHILVVEYKDAILPLFVRNADLTRGLFRNDLVRLSYGLQSYPDQPLHLRLNEAFPRPVEVLESMKARHGQPITLEGPLVLFPKSPAISFNVFAVLQDLPGGLKRQFTLVNFDDPALFAGIRAKLQAAWDRHPGEYANGRNKLVSTRLRVKVTGAFSEVDANQANPQILPSSLEAVEVLEN